MEESDEVVVLYEYTAQLPDELNLKVGDVVTKVERMDGGWWQGELAGKRGMFPDNFVKVQKQTKKVNYKVGCVLLMNFLVYSSTTTIDKA